MLRGPQVGLLLAAALLALGSSAGKSGGHGAKGLRPQRDQQLVHPALRVVNRSDQAMVVRLRGSTKRDVIAPPGENIRTLIAAGVYRYEVRVGRRILRRGAVRLRKGYRYHLELAP